MDAPQPALIAQVLGGAASGGVLAALHLRALRTGVDRALARGDGIALALGLAARLAAAAGLLGATLALAGGTGLVTAALSYAAVQRALLRRVTDRGQARRRVGLAPPHAEQAPSLGSETSGTRKGGRRGDGL